MAAFQERPRGRPRSPGGAKSQSEIQPALPRPAGRAGSRYRRHSPDLKIFVEMRDKLDSALLKLELRDQDVARREQRNAYLEGELKLQGQHHTNALKEVIVLKQELAKRS